MTLGQPLSQDVPAPRSDPPLDVEHLLRLIETYDLVDWPTGANLLAQAYRELVAARAADEVAAAAQRAEYTDAVMHWNAAHKDTVRLAKLLDELPALRAMESRLDGVLRGQRFPTWIGKRIAYWIKHGSLGWPYS